MATFDANGTKPKEVGLNYSGIDVSDSKSKEVSPISDGESAGGGATVVRENPRLIRDNP